MAGSPYSGNGTKPTLPLVAPNDGEDVTYATFIQLVIFKMIDWLSYLDAGGSSVPGYTGASFTVGDGNPAHSSALLTFLHLLADKAAKLDQANTFTAGMGVVGNILLVGDLLLGGALRLTAGSSISRTVTAVATNATTLTMDAASSSEYVAEAWDGAGGTLTVTLAAYVGVIPNPEMTLKFGPAAPSHRAIFLGGSDELTGIASIAFRWDGAAWKFRTSAGEARIGIT